MLQLPYPNVCTCRDPIKCGSVIRLQHLQTRLFLHSHKFTSPLSGNQEVSCFGDGNVGDTGMHFLVCHCVGLEHTCAYIVRTLNIPD